LGRQDKVAVTSDGARRMAGGGEANNLLSWGFDLLGWYVGRDS